MSSSNIPVERWHCTPGIRLAVAFVSVLLACGNRPAHADNGRSPRGMAFSFNEHEARDTIGPTNVEPERVRPEPTLGLSIPRRPGTQTIVLRDYLGSGRSDPPPLQPVVLHVPDRFFARTQTFPQEVWGLNLHLRYPEMEPLPASSSRCSGWCDGYMLLSLELRDPAHTTRPLLNHQAAIARGIVAGITGVNSAPMDVPPGYTEAYVLNLTNRQPPQPKWIYVRKGMPDMADEYVECVPTAPSPACRFFMPLEGRPQIQVQYSISMDFWNKRAEVKAAVQQLVRSLLE